MVTQSSAKLGNPAIPIMKPHMQIDGKIICHDVATTLRDAALLPPYHQYLRKKYDWSAKDLCNVHWYILRQSLSKFLQEDQHQLVLFLNNKLPLRTSKAHPHYGSPLCPSCQCKPEDLWHFLECQQHEWARSTFYQVEEWANGPYPMSPTPPVHLHSHIAWAALYPQRLSLPNITADVLPQLVPPIQYKTCLGWEHIFQGCWPHTGHLHLTCSTPTLPQLANKCWSILPPPFGSTYWTTGKSKTNICTNAKQPYPYMSNAINSLLQLKMLSTASPLMRSWNTPLHASNAGYKKATNTSTDKSRQ